MEKEQRTTDHTDDTDGSDEIRKGAAAFCTACPPVCGKCFRSAMRPRIAFARAPPQKKATRGRARTPKVPRLRDKHNGQNLRKLATASSSCGELRKLSSIVVRMTRILRQ